MHIGIWMVMRLTFTSNTYLLILLAFPWALGIDYVLQRLDASQRERIEALSVRVT
jgi:hypothetical protein